MAGSIERRIEALENLYGVPSTSPGDEEARRRRAQETLAELKRRLDRIAEKATLEERVFGASRRRHALEDLEETMHRRGTIQRLYRHIFGDEIGEEEYERRLGSSTAPSA